VRERKRESYGDRWRGRGMAHMLFFICCVCVYVCVGGGEREGEREKVAGIVYVCVGGAEREGEREKVARIGGEGGA